MSESKGISAHGTIVRRNGVAIEDLMEVVPPGLLRKPYERTTAGDGDDESYWMGIRGAKELIFGIALTSSHGALFTAWELDSLDTYEVQFADGAIWSFDGYVEGIAPHAPVDGLYDALVIIRPAGAININVGVGSFLLQENGDFLLLETGDQILL